MRVALFIPCFVDLLTPQVGVSMTRVLRRVGVSVTYPQGQTCCGQPAFNAGHQAEAGRAAEHFLTCFAAADVDYVVSPSASCAAMVTRYYPVLFPEGSRQRAAAIELAPRVVELSAFLVDVLGVEDVGASLAGRAVFHTGCHQRRELGIESQPLRLLSHVRQLQLANWEHAQLCCGFGGTFAVKMPDVSTAMADEKVRAFEASGADTLISCDPSCLLQLGGRMRRLGIRARVLHLAEVLDTATDLPA